jgi:hypothetical protein
LKGIAQGSIWVGSNSYIFNINEDVNHFSSIFIHKIHCYICWFLCSHLLIYIYILLLFVMLKFII